MGDVLELNDVSVRRGNRMILDGVDWSVNEGERWVVLGPNGAGKTTVIQLVAGRLHPTTGTVTIIGEEVGRTDLAELRPLVGLASAALDQRLPSGERAIDVVVTASYGITGRWREEYDELDLDRAQTLLDVFGVGHLAERTYGTLSSGERKRVQIARALMPDPEVLLLDEPAAGLDLGGREELLAALSELAGDGRSPVMVLVTHHVEEIPSGFTHALLLRDGVVEAAGPIEDVLTPQHLSAAFGLELEVERHRDRYSARAAGTAR
ncbi:ABC transporter ATP-binding protein [Georgenia sp. EYE_87]|uniref:ABC transporter ATP-binding protein n=1 Tax=Georgenia sp. EYE_87 TaxID=2853448 RepID=UPI0020065B17|nr:ABC transporter ATP-binding protein [Georgenia sp. EYE_87]MCK6212183.1 ABC transporter ATP-binding protein [Georgenia sp. EYE_87]